VPVGDEVDQLFLARGGQSALTDTPWCFNAGSGPGPKPPTPGGKCDVGTSEKIDCGKSGSTQDTCEADGCCWSPASANPFKFGLTDTPWCYY